MAMRLRQSIGQRHADRAHRDVDGALRECRDSAAVSKHDRFDRRVVGEHGDDKRVAPRVGRSGGDPRAFRRQRLRFVARSVMDGQAMAGREQVARDRAAHIAEPNETDIHACLPGRRPQHAPSIMSSRSPRRPWNGSSRSGRARSSFSPDRASRSARRGRGRTNGAALRSRGGIPPPDRCGAPRSICRWSIS